MKPSGGEEGFTLVELAIVLLIIGIIVSVAIPVFSSLKLSEQKKLCYANQRTIEGAAQTYAAGNGMVLPTTVADLVPRYLKSVPHCPNQSAADYSFDAAKADGSVSACTDADHGYYQQ